METIMQTIEVLNDLAAINNTMNNKIMIFQTDEVKDEEMKGIRQKTGETLHLI